MADIGRLARPILPEMVYGAAIFVARDGKMGSAYDNPTCATVVVHIGGWMLMMRLCNTDCLLLAVVPTLSEKQINAALDYAHETDVVRRC